MAPSIGKKRCAACGAEAPAAARVCPKCGKKLPDYTDAERPEKERREETERRSAEAESRRAASRDLRPGGDDKEARIKAQVEAWEAQRREEKRFDEERKKKGED